jgi:3-phenylpropionate/cinnamic acid dioxygenase small subunit
VNALLIDTERAIATFLYREAKLLDTGKFDQWLDLFTDDLHYWMPMRSTRERGVETLTGPGEMAHFDDSKPTLTLRVKRLDTKSAWAEDPPSHTRRLVTNVLVEPQGDGEWLVESNFLIYRTRLGRIENLFIGAREDLLRSHDDSFRIARRTIVLDSTTLTANNLTLFF